MNEKSRKCHTLFDQGGYGHQRPTEVSRLGGSCVFFKWWHEMATSTDSGSLCVTYFPRGKRERGGSRVRGLPIFPEGKEENGREPRAPVPRTKAWCRWKIGMMVLLCLASDATDVRVWAVV